MFRVVAVLYLAIALDSFGNWSGSPPEGGLPLQFSDRSSKEEGVRYLLRTGYTTAGLGKERDRIVP